LVRRGAKYWRAPATYNSFDVVIKSPLPRVLLGGSPPIKGQVQSDSDEGSSVVWKRRAIPPAAGSNHLIRTMANCCDDEAFHNDDGDEEEDIRHRGSRGTRGGEVYPVEEAETAAG
jgi:hypothetical protein